jgi:hypothetical protein
VDELRTHATYQVLLTTGGGLYRYRLGDAVCVDGSLGRTPSIRFVGRAGLVSDQRGEKLADRFVGDVLAEFFQMIGRPRPSFALLAPEVDSANCRYVLFMSATIELERVAALDALLCRNPHYAYCRRLGQLGVASVATVGDDAYAKYTGRLVERGQRLGDIKPAALSPLEGWSAVFGVVVRT